MGEERREVEGVKRREEGKRETERVVNVNVMVFLFRGLESIKLGTAVTDIVGLSLER